MVIFALSAASLIGDAARLQPAMMSQSGYGARTRPSRSQISQPKIQSILKKNTFCSYVPWLVTGNTAGPLNTPKKELSCYEEYIFGAMLSNKYI